MKISKKILLSLSLSASSILSAHAQVVTCNRYATCSNNVASDCRMLPYNPSFPGGAVSYTGVSAQNFNANTVIVTNQGGQKGAFCIYTGQAIPAQIMQFSSAIPLAPDFTDGGWQQTSPGVYQCSMTGDDPCRMIR